eukprot:TRINITY_DN2151_c0_g1_i1.p1 TRINITY_DN2151_c0_g1~~TRINITY_DN2151_c0_g1_i1.p1  ORF type:complete len:538 (-),score=139.64 TRINITY_DN2151_c0_g1_i1:175-1788(-)
MGGVCGTDGQDGGQILLGASDQLQDGTMKEFSVQDNKILLIRQHGKVRGVSNKCTHYGAPLVKGALGDGFITCPWHGACFSTETGDIEDFPGCSSLMSYKIIEEGGNLYLELPKDINLSTTKRERFLGARKVEKESEHVVIVGGGAAGHTAIETFRAEGYKGKVTLVSAEKHLPYDRPKLSKKLDSKPEEMYLRSRDWYEEAGIELKLGTPVAEVQPQDKTLKLSSGEVMTYDKLLYCTGGMPRRLGVAGEELEGVHYLRTPEDANAIAENAEGKNLVVVGGSFIGMEVSASLVKKAGSVTVIDRNSTSFQSSLGPQVGAILQQIHRDNGVNFEMNSEVESIEEKEGGGVASVKLKSGKVLPADLVLIGAGVLPSTQPFQAVQDFLQPKGVIRVDEFMQSSDPNIWAAGDIVEFPMATYNNELVTIGHWGLAMYMGKIAALNIMGKQEPAKTVPFFWTMQYGKSIRFAGLCNGCDSTLVESDETGFLQLYTKDDLVMGVCTLGRDPIAAHFRNLVLKGEKLKLEDAAEKLKAVLPKS